MAHSFLRIKTMYIERIEGAKGTFGLLATDRIRKGLGTQLRLDEDAQNSRDKKL